MKSYGNYTKVYMSTGNKALSPMWNFISGGSKHELDYS